MPNAKRDAEDVTDLLGRANFKVIRLFEGYRSPTKHIMESVMILAPKLQPSDSVTFYFVGHGWNEVIGAEPWGHLVPQGGIDPYPRSRKMILMKFLQDSIPHFISNCL